jgi:HAE1 family hydrophobic/amphiphilic exporter-1
MGGVLSRLTARCNAGDPASRVGRRRSSRPFMQWLASLCIRQPVFTWVLMLVFVVVGAFGYFSLGGRPVPQGRLPDHRRHDDPQRRGAGGDRDRAHRQDRGGGQHDQRHRRAPLDVEPGRLARHHHVRPDKDADVAAQEVRDHINNVLPDLPKGIDQPVVSKVDPDASPILFVTLQRPGSIRDVTELADKRSAARSRASTASGRSTSSAARSARSTSGSTR